MDSSSGSEFDYLFKLLMIRDSCFEACCFSLSLDGPVVTALGFGDELGVVTHSSPSLPLNEQMLTFDILNLPQKRTKYKYNKQVFDQKASSMIENMLDLVLVQIMVGFNLSHM
ncbi:uncharacterized protein LOC110904500 [Helianthus annuus]|uniref:uncharacterized protein LOC110904500 n=1 Tax=Helianthus annuus TaxID=4232 RepID=UPI000B906989|nr:uncharacterized protein LOC110904500 [Helianthus annuus]